MSTENEFDRKTYVGSSDAASIVGVSPFKSAFQVYQEKIGAFVEEVDEEREKRFKRGKKFEPIILEMLYEDLVSRGHDVEFVARNERLRDKELHFLASESDAVLRLDGEIISAEAKSVNGFAAKLWGEQETDDFPIYYQCQTLHDLMVKGRQKCVVACLVGTDDFRIYWIDRDDELIAGIRQKEIEFWDRVQRRDPPEPTTANDVDWLYKSDSGESLEADAELLALCTELSNLQKDAKAIENRFGILSTRLKVRMKNAALIRHDGKKLCSWGKSKDSKKTNWEEAFFELVNESKGLGKADVDLIIKNHTATKPGSRKFSVK